MRNIQKRSLSLLVVIALCLSFIVPAVQTPAAAATVNYKYSGNYIYNWGNRDEVATFLSPNAVSFYQGNGVSYNALAAMAGASNTADVPNSPLYRELQDLMSSEHTHKTSYSETKELYQYTDCQNNGKTTTQISSFYSGMLIGPDWDGGATWNREHTWPNSKGLDGQDENDIMMLRPTAKSENFSRGNTAYGESSSYYDPNECGMNLHGDVARIMLYQYVRWGNASKMWGASGVMESKEILLKWMEEDPVDTWEMGRNDAVEAITGTRNVFVDYPELAFQLFDEEVPENYSAPSNGTHVEITMVTVQFSENGTVTNLITAAEDKQITLPEPMAYVPAGYTFVGWVESTVADTTTKPAVRTAGSKFAAEDIVLHALYSITEESEGGSTGGGESGYIKVTDAANITTGQYVMVLDAGYAPSVYNSGWVEVVQPTIDGDKVTDTKNAVWTLTVSGSSVVLTDANGTSIKPKSGNDNGIQTGSYNWNWSFADGKVTFKGAGSDTTTLAANKGSSYKLRAYKNSTVSGNATGYPSLFTLYKLTEAQGGGSTTTVTYTITIAPCEHANTEDRAVVAAQCEIAGTEAGVFCLDCQTYISGGTEIEALEHIWVAGEVTPPTETQQGYTTYTCSRGCGATKHDDFTDALGVKYTVKFSVPTGVTPIADALVDGIEGTTLPVPSGTPGTGYQFVGWAEAAVETTTAMPTVLDEFYIPTSNITLYAVYTYVVGGSGKTEYTLVTSADQLGLGHEIVIVGVDGTTNYAMSTTQNGNNRGRAEVAVNENTVSWAESAGVQTIILEEGTVEGTYAMNVGTGYLYAASGSNNYLRTQATVDANASWLITFKEGVPTVKAQGANAKNWLRHNTGNDIFSCYSSGQADVKLYSKGIPGTVYYSSLSCTHANATAIPEVEAKCETNGYEEGVFCEDCQTYISGGDVIPMLGHNMVAGTVVPPTATEQGYTVYNCANGCGKSEQRDYTDPTGEIFEVSFVVPTGVTAVASMNINALTGATLPTAGVPTGEHAYVFAGWAEAAITEATTTVPVFYTGNYKPRENVTLYPVYSYVEQGAGATETAWVKTALAEIQSTDKVVITMTKGDTTWAMSQTKGGDGQPTAVEVDVSSDKLIGAVEQTVQWNIIKDGNNLTIHPNGNTAQWLYCTNANNGVRIGTGDAKTFVVDAASGYLHNSGTKDHRDIGVYNSQDWRCYKNNGSIASNIAGQTLAFFVEAEIANTGAKTYYTSANAVAPSNPNPNPNPDPTPDPDPDEPTTGITELKTGDQVVIFAPAYNKALSSELVSGTYYQQGVDVTLADGTVTGYGDTEIWTVTVNSDGTYSFAYGDQNIGMAASYSSMSLGAVNDKWELTDLGGGLYNVKNTVRGNYMEWYASKNNWSTYTSESVATDGQFRLSFYVIGKGILTGGDTEIDIPLNPPADPIALTNVNIALNSSLDISFNGLASVLDQYENVYVVFEAEGKQTAVVSDYFVTGEGENTRYNFTYKGLNILDMSLTIKATIHGTFNGKEYVGETKEYSLLKYATTALSNEEVAQRRGVATVCANLLQYAIAAEAYKPEAAAENLVKDLLTEEQRTNMNDLTLATDTVTLGENKDLVNGTQVKFTGQALEMLARITLRFNFKIDDAQVSPSQVTCTVSYTDGDGQPKQQNYTLDQLKKDGDVYIVEFSDFNATQMRERVTCTLYIDGVAHATYANSIENYCYVTVRDQNPDELKTLVKRICRYGDACDEFFNGQTLK